MEPIETTQLVKQNVWWLIKHTYNIVFRHNSWNERISKGELLVAGMTLAIIVNLTNVILSLILSGSESVGGIMIILVALVSFYFSLKLTKQRFNDLGLGARGMWRYIGSIIVTIILIIVASILGANGSIGGAIVLGIAALVILCISLRYKILLQWENGSQGDNKYGTDPLLRQPYSNKAYIIYYAIVGGILMIIVFVGIMGVMIGLADKLGGQGLGGLKGMMKQDFSNMNDYQQTNDEDIMNQNNIDSTQSLDQQIDTTIQAEDQSAIMEATTATSN